MHTSKICLKPRRFLDSNVKQQTDFPARRLNTNRYRSHQPRHLYQHPAKTRQQQEAIANQLRNAIPMELPRPTVQLVARRATQETRLHDGDRDKDCGEEVAYFAALGGRYGTLGTCGGSSAGRQPPTPSLIKSSSSLPLSPHPGHHPRHRGQDGRRCHHPSLEANRTISSTLGAHHHHPATFTDVRYSSRRSSYRPGLNFFEQIPPGALGGVACTLIFLDTDAAARVIGTPCTLLLSCVLRNCQSRF